ncbi:DEAD-domain-containing protein [Melanogaster broomeanus]|nr:DEAD-domain-containing protein [Melanogaster broomeanus]
MPSPSIEPGVPKTTAKARYLKRKKIKRKARKAATPRKAREADIDSLRSEDEDKGRQEADGPEDEEDFADEKEPIARLMKKKKVDEQERDLVMLTDTDVRREESQPPGIRSPFSQPALPDAPPKSALAMQGLDEAIVHAEVINPSIALPLSSSEVVDGTGLSARNKKATALLPFLIGHGTAGQSLYSPYSLLRDVCVSAPTGSGKTLAYVLPILETLTNRVVTRLRALIVLPTRDLVNQVRETFEAVGKGRGLKIGTATGQHSFPHEQAQLVLETASELQGGSSKVDVLVCTPGRLMDHLNGTPNFSLQHLRFLVIDEADRLLAQSFQDWLVQVLAAIHHRTPSEDVFESPSDDVHLVPSNSSLAPASLRPLSEVDVSERREPSCQKLLFSATLTRDPGKLASLGLREPKYFVVQNQVEGMVPGPLDLVSERFTMPATLTEHMIVCESSTKPLLLLHLIHNHSVRNAIVFTKSSESTTRLVCLLEFFEELTVSDQDHILIRAYSSDLPAGERKSILEQFKAQEVHILVCSDLISRGIDVSHVSHVVSYDVPIDMRKYVHRVGRTARAGRDGDAWTLVEEQEARYFKSMLKEYDHLDRVKRMKVSPKETEPLTGKYQVALQMLKKSYVR